MELKRQEPEIDLPEEPEQIEQDNSISMSNENAEINDTRNGLNLKLSSSVVSAPELLDLLVQVRQNIIKTNNNPKERNYIK